MPLGLLLKILEALPTINGTFPSGPIRARFIRTSGNQDNDGERFGCDSPYLVAS